MLKLAFRNVLRQRTRSLLTLFAIALGVACFVLAGGFVADILHQLREATIHSQLGHLQIYKAGRYASDGSHPFDYLIDDPAAVDNALAGIGGVTVHARRLDFTGLASFRRGELPMIGEGIEPGPEATMGSAITIVQGRALRVGDTYAVMLGEGLAKALGAKPGDAVDLVLASRDGAMNTMPFDVVGIFRTLSREFDARALRVTLAAAQELTATSGVSSVVVLLDDTAHTDAALAALSARLPPGYEVKPWYELATFYNSTAALYRRQFGFLQAIILVMVLLGVSNSVTMTLHERTAEFGVMRALGDKGSRVFGLAVLEGLVLGMIGAGIGVVAAALIAIVVSAIGIPMPPPPNSESGFVAAIRIVPGVLAFGFALGLAATVGGALVPSWRIAKLPIVDALGRSG
jgi:putative ABC transport system permease protein